MKLSSKPVRQAINDLARMREPARARETITEAGGGASRKWIARLYVRCARLERRGETTNILLVPNKPKRGKQ